MSLKQWAGRAGLTGSGLFTGLLLAAHFLHPTADFPNFSPWMDYAKYTDEGWYGSAAVAYFTRGGWYVPGDFNPGVALPVWPFLEWILFHLTGVGLSAARLFTIAIFAGNLVLTYALVRSQASRWAAWLATVLLAANAFLYCFSRLAILEPLMIFLLLLSWLLALRLAQMRLRWQRALLASGIGVLLCGMVLTKTTAIFLLPSIFCILWLAHREAASGFPKFVSSSATVTLATGLPWLLYYFAAVRPRYLEDYRYFFTANVYPQPATAGGWLMAFWYSLHGVLWVDPRLTLLAGALLLVSLLFFREIWCNPLFAAALTAIAGYLFFIGFHNNMQPRYYQVVAFPMVIATAMALNALSQQRGFLRPAGGAVAACVLALSIWRNAYETLWFALHPQYTFVNAAENLTRYVDQHPNGNRVLLSISAGNVALVTGLPALCDDFGTLDLPERLRRYQPGYYAAWNDLDPGTLEDLHTQFELQEVAHYPAFDDEDRDTLILYKLIPLRPSGKGETSSSPSS